MVVQSEKEIEKKVWEKIRNRFSDDALNRIDVWETHEAVRMAIEETVKAIIEDIEFNKGKGRELIPEADGFVIKLKDWKKLKEKWLK